MFQTRCWATAAAPLVSIGWVGTSAAAILNVPGDFATIQACVEAAVSGVDECVVAPGTYHETINFLGKAITVRSSDGADVTTIDATGIAWSVVTCRTREGPKTVLDGFTITGGIGTNLGNGTTRGGGMYNEQSSPTVSNCTFAGNVSTGYAGGMYNYYSSPTVSNCTFIRNVSTGHGGAIYNQGGSPTITNCTFNENKTGHDGGAVYSQDGSPTLTGCTFIGNTATSLGGGIYNHGANNTMTVRDCTFTGNTAAYGGGMKTSSASPTVINCAFLDNRAISGGGIYVQGGTPSVINCTFSGNSGGGMSNTTSSHAVVVGCTFSGNTAAGMSNGYSSPTIRDCTFIGNRGGFGGGMSNTASSPKVTNCTFSGNSVSGQLPYGGGMYNSNGSSPTVTNCTFSGNSASLGGAMYNGIRSTPAITGCTFSGNTAGDGGAVYNYYESSATVANCVLRGDIPDEIVNTNLSAPTMSFSDVQGGLPVGAVDGGGNIDLDPMFVRPLDPGPDGTWDGVDDDYGDLRVQAGSPCIDAGDPGFIAQSGETDLEGHARVLCSRVDMGAYEFGIGDYDCDQSVDLMDFNAWNACMTAPHDVRELALAALTSPGVRSAIDNRQLAIGCEAFDFDADGDVDLLDFAAFQSVLTAP
ncbi:MAG: right-handed parallel beta-helix repeat-containing protein [Planctomycetota bacterium]